MASPDYIYGTPLDAAADVDARTDLISYRMDADAVIAAWDRLVPADPPAVKAPAPVSGHKRLYSIADESYHHERIGQLLREADEHWSKGRWPAALQTYVQAVSVSPRAPRAFGALLRFLLMSYADWNRGDDQRNGRALALALSYTLSNQKGGWIAERIAEIGAAQPDDRFIQALVEEMIGDLPA